jgi:hypothetical protein
LSRGRVPIWRGTRKGFTVNLGSAFGDLMTRRREGMGGGISDTLHYMNHKNCIIISLLSLAFVTAMNCNVWGNNQDRTVWRLGTRHENNLVAYFYTLFSSFQGQPLTWSRYKHKKRQSLPVSRFTLRHSKAVLFLPIFPRMR